MNSEFWVYVALLAWIVVEIRHTRSEVVEAKRLAVEVNGKIAELQARLAPDPAPLFPYKTKSAPLPLPK
jgi:hypothetical protein